MSSDKILIIYGKSSKDKEGNKKPSKVIHGGSTFVWPYFQGYTTMSLIPIQFKCTIADALSSQYIRVTVPITATVAVNSEEPFVQNAVSRLAGLTEDTIIEMTREIIYGQFREIISKSSIEQLNADRDAFRTNCEQSIASELNKLGLKLININIVDIQDEAGYIANIGKKEAAKAVNQAKVETAEEDKQGATKSAEIEKDKATQVAETEKNRISILAETKKEEAIKVAETEKNRVSALAEIEKEKATQVAEADRIRETTVAETKAQESASIVQSKNNAAVEIAKSDAERESKQVEFDNSKEIKIAQSNSEMEIRKAEAEKNAMVGKNEAMKAVATSEGELKVTEAEAERKAREAQVIADAKVKERQELQQKAVEEARAQKVETQLKAEKIVPAEIEKEKARLNAEAYQNEVTGKAKAEAEAIKLKAEAEAAAIRLKQEAEAAGIQAKLEAEAEGKRKSALAEAEGFKATMEAAKGNETLAIHYKMVTQYKEIAGEQVKAFEKMNLGNINIFDTGDGKGAGKFMKDIVNTVAPATSVLSEMPVIGKAVKALESALDKKNESENGEGDVKSSAFEEVK